MRRSVKNAAFHFKKYDEIDNIYRELFKANIDNAKPMSTFERNLGE